MKIVSPQETASLQGWKHNTYAEFRERMLDTETPFPCVFGVEAVSRGTLRYGFVEGKSLNDQSLELSRILKEYTEICRDLGRRTSLVVFFENWEKNDTHDAYFEYFWNLLKATSNHDSEEWPEEHSSAVDDFTFEYSYNKQPMFVVVNTPLHVSRLSRNFGRVAITFQPRFVFDDIAEGTKHGDAARVIIRDRLKQYDNVPITPELGSYGDPKNREWKQYYLDDGTEIPALTKCPVHEFSEGAK